MKINREQESLKNKGYFVPIKVSHVIREQHTKIKETYGLIDTGASTTTVDFQLIEYLNLQSSKSRKLTIQTPYYKVEGIKCPLKVTFPS